MINVATMKTNNVGLILGAFALNGLAVLVSMIAWLVPAVLGAVVAVLVLGGKLLRTIAAHWRLLAMVAGLVLAVALVLIFWQAILVGAGVLGGMYAGLLAVMRS